MSAVHLADLVFLVHLLFICFAAAGGILVLRWPRLAWLHLPAVVWGTAVELFDWTCPLTPLEDTLRRSAGEPELSGGFLAHYLAFVIYPEWLTRERQIALGVTLAAINLPAYGWLFWRSVRGGRP